MPSGTHVLYVYVYTPTLEEYRYKVIPMEIWVSDTEGGHDAAVDTLCAKFLSPAPVYTADCGGVAGTFVTFVKRPPAPHSNHRTHHEPP